MRRAWCVIGICFLLAVSPALADEHDVEPEPEAPVIPADPSRAEAPLVSLVVIGPLKEGTDSLYGHTTLMVHRSDPIRNVAYSYAVFKEEPVMEGLPAAAIGRAQMELRLVNATNMISGYESEGRQVHRIPLLLTSDERWALIDNMEDRRANEGIVRYQMVRDNCSTRIRDSIDIALGGAFATATAHSTGKSIRDIGITYVDHRKVSAPLWSFLYGSHGDRELTHWESMFLPLEFELVIQETRLVDGENTRAIAGAPEVLVRATPVNEGLHGPDPDHSVLALGGAALVLAFVASLMINRHPMLTRLTLSPVLLFIGTFTSLVSWIIIEAWGGKWGPHISENHNFLIASPVAVVLIPLSILLFIRPFWAWRLLAWTSVASGVLLLVALLIRWLPDLSAQDNWAAMAFATMAWGGLALIAVVAGGPTTLIGPTPKREWKFPL